MKNHKFFFIKALTKILTLSLLLSLVIGKTIPAQAALPPDGPAGETLVEKNKDGSPKQERTYGPDGKAEYDVDYNHGGVGHVFPHGHEWDWSQENPRQPGKPIPTPCPAPIPDQGASNNDSNNSSDTAKKIAEGIGLGTILYFIISEGSRIVIPIRNLIPII